MLIRWLTSPQKSRSSSRKTRWERQSKHGPLTSARTCWPTGHLPLLCPSARIRWLLCLLFLGSRREAALLRCRLYPLIPVSQPSVSACHFLATRSTCLLYDHSGHCPKRTLMESICIKHFFFYGHDFSLSFFSFHIKRYEIWAFGGGDGRESGLFWVVLGTLLLSTAFHIPEWRVCSESSSTLTSSMCPVNVNDQ